MICGIHATGRIASATYTGHTPPLGAAEAPFTGNTHIGDRLSTVIIAGGGSVVFFIV